MKSGIFGNKNTRDIAVKNSVGVINIIIFWMSKFFCLICLIVPNTEIKKTNSKE